MLMSLQQIQSLDIRLQYGGCLVFPGLKTSHSPVEAASLGSKLGHVSYNITW